MNNVVFAIHIIHTSERADSHIWLRLYAQMAEDERAIVAAVADTKAVSLPSNM